MSQCQKYVFPFSVLIRKGFWFSLLSSVFQPDAAVGAAIFLWVRSSPATTATKQHATWKVRPEMKRRTCTASRPEWFTVNSCCRLSLEANIFHLVLFLPRSKRNALVPFHVVETPIKNGQRWGGHEPKVFVPFWIGQARQVAIKHRENPVKHGSMLVKRWTVLFVANCCSDL